MSRGNGTYYGDNGRRQRALLQALPVKALEPSGNKQSSHQRADESDALTSQVKVFFLRERERRREKCIFISFFHGDSYLCFWMSLTPFFKFPSLSVGLSLHKVATHTLVQNGNQPRVNSLQGQSLTCIAFWWGWQHFWWFSLKIQSCQCPSEWCCRSSWDQGRRTEGCPGREGGDVTFQNNCFCSSEGKKEKKQKRQCLISQGVAYLPVRSSNMRIPRDQ